MSVKKVLFLVLAIFLAGCNVAPAGDQSANQPTIEPTKVSHQSILPTVDFSKITPEGDGALPDCIADLQPQYATVVSVTDGDTIQVDINGVHYKVRYEGVDTPEMEASNTTPGVTAKAFNASLVDKQQVALYRGEEDRDSYGRLLRFVMVGDKFVNYELILQGYATSYNRPHDARCSDYFNNAMLGAYKKHSGIWVGFDQLYPSTTEESCPEGCEKHLEGCDIKGNISQYNEYIFHLPGTADYAGVTVSPSKGERWFCSIGEALTNGYRPSRVK